MTDDLSINNALILDGSGSEPFVGNLRVRNGRITAINAGADPTDLPAARETIDADGLALMPGIVDLHTHFDAQITWDRSMSPSPALGVTTAVMGNCGFGIAPCPPEQRETMLKNLSVVEGMDLPALLQGVDWGFETFAEYLEHVRRIGPAVNVAVFAGHSAIRTAVMGEAASEQVEPSAEQLAQMGAMVTEAMDAGAIGFASSFSPNHSGYGGRPMPSTIATEHELQVLTDAMAQGGNGVFMSATGSRLTPAHMEAIVARTGRPAFISTVLAMHNDANPDLCKTYYAACRESQARGNPLYMLTSCQPLRFDFSLRDPYLLLSHDAFDVITDKSDAALIRTYGDPQFRERFRENLRAPGAGILFLGDWSRIEISRCGDPALVGQAGCNIAALAAEQGADPVDVFFDLAIQDNLDTRFLARLFQDDDEGVGQLLRDPASVVTLSDAGAHLLYFCDAGFGLHFLSHWVRDTKTFSLAEGVRRLTSEPADRFCIPGRGRLLEGLPADLLLFDPGQVGLSAPISVSDLPGGASRMVREPKGCHGVWVNGVLVHDGQTYIQLPHGPGAVLNRFTATLGSDSPA